MIGISNDCSSVGKESACNTGDLGSIPGSPGRSPGEGNGSPLQYSCLESPMNRGAWQATVHGVARVGHNWTSLHFMVFPVVIYECESWNIKKAESQRIDAFEQRCWKRFFESPLTARR